MVDEDFAALAAAWSRRHGLDQLDDQQTLTGIPVPGLATPEHGNVADAAAYAGRLGFPGEFPFTRGISPRGYRKEPWVMGMYSGRASPAETNRRIKNLLEHGQRGFSIALDLPTQNGLDSDHPLAAGEVGKVGVPIDSLTDMVELLDGIRLDTVSQIRTTANAIGPLATALFIAAAQVNGYQPSQFKVLLQNDVLKEHLARGTYIFPPRAGLEFCIDVVEYCARHLPHWEPIEFCGYHIRDAGSSAVQELAFALSNGREYIEAALRRGLSIDEFGDGIYLFLAAHIDIFEEVAKFRAARRLWSALMRDDYGSTEERTAAAKIFVYTLGSVQTAQEPLNNIARIAYQALAAALGGVQTLATSSYDEALRLPSDLAAKVGLRTQQILAYETGVSRTVDPLGGSYLVEYLTDELERAIRAEMQRISEMGGALVALETGWLREQIDEHAYQTQMQIERKELTVVGVNRFVETGGAATVEFAAAADDFEMEQCERLRAVRARRSGTDVAGRLHEVSAAARSRHNTIPSILAAIHAEATIGEICSALASVWGYADSRAGSVGKAKAAASHIEVASTS